MRLYKLGVITALVLGGLLAFTTLSSAQDNKAEGKKRPNFSPQQQAERMATELKLNDEQKTKVTAVFAEQGKKMQELRDNTSLSQEDRREKMRTMREDSDKKLKSILTTEQWDKWQEVRKQMRKGGGKKAEKKSE